jgi:hypothetical protein
MVADDGQPRRGEIRRFVPDEPFPPYSYVNGSFPHPIRDPSGHSFDAVPVPCPIPNPNQWYNCRPYLFGLDLFNHGYYWEAHEVWEGIWHASGRGGPVGSFIKALIKLAAAGVKVRQRRPEGVRRHARRAAELFSHVADLLPAEQVTYFGLSLPWLIDLATDVASKPPVSIAPIGTPVEVVFQFALCPDGPQRSEPAR